MSTVVILPMEGDLDQRSSTDDSHHATKTADPATSPRTTVHKTTDLHTTDLHTTRTVHIATDAEKQLTPYEAAQQLVARQDVHIARVWPMRSPSTAPLEDSSSANFQAGRTGIPPAGVMPVGGLRMTQAFTHEPVMATEVVELFAPAAQGLIVDATVGGAGHAVALLEAYPDIELLGIDRDPRAVESATARLAAYGDRATVHRARFDGVGPIVFEHLGAVAGDPRAEVSGVLFDLGVSSPQLDSTDRGFSYRRDAPLDMRMDPSSGRTAADIVNESSEDVLVELFTQNGEGRFARRIARAIMAARPIQTTGQLADVVRAAIPAATRRTGGHPARRVFQAIRIAVNEELDQLDRALVDALHLLKPGGRCVVISYHSGEDRLVKGAFQQAATGGCTCPPGLPCVCGAVVDYRLVHRGSRRPSPAEVERNRRSEAARLRVIERIDHAQSGRDDTETPRRRGPGEVA
ncbi:MAG TPA: 16S rRNA (cytosine(1402)-N(4))-methyltransferase RsmH [Acidimicrobiales bacterium]|nr:16S rRNA (cytosine(1402)-N(4))-methyltransferase RsmH [Acidimicrobiales bacterium]